jgi:BirA family biotin operon repressor/biotin-[acetyl-CoA-carboxylase] ligase
VNQDKLERSLGDLELGGIRYYESIGSTNDAAADWARQGAADFSLVIADEQVQGRGRAGRKWITKPGSALAFSLILRASAKETAALSRSTARLTGLGALAVNQVLREKYALPAQIKWPNDVLVNRRKLCGVLAEADWIGNQLSSVILGIGINIATHAVPADGSLVYPATSVEQESKQRVDRVILLRQVLEEILHLRRDLLDDKFLQLWEDRLAFRDEWVEVAASGNRGQTSELQLRGRILGLNPDGALRLRTISGDEVIIQQGEIPSVNDDIRLRPVDRSPK